MSLRYCFRCNTTHQQDQHCPNTSSLTSRGSTRQWRQTRAAALSRAGHACERCGAPATEVHHKTERIIGGQDITTNLQALCTECHKEA